MKESVVLFMKFSLLFSLYHKLNYKKKTFLLLKRAWKMNNRVFDLNSRVLQEDKSQSRSFIPGESRRTAVQAPEPVSACFLKMAYLTIDCTVVPELQFLVVFETKSQL